MIGGFRCSLLQEETRELKHRRLQRSRKRHLKIKYNFNSFVLLWHYFNSFNFYRNGELPRNQIGRSGVKGKEDNEKFTVMCSRSPQNLEFGHFTLLFCRERHENVPKLKTHVQSDCFCS